MSDLISRQAVRFIESEPDAYPQEWNEDYEKGFCDAINAVLALPSAQPEIIHCGDCKYKDDGIDEDGITFLKCLNGRSYGGTRINDFCSWAERRTDD